MSPLRIGGYVPSELEQQPARRNLQMIVQSNPTAPVLLENLELQGLGFPPDKAMNARRAFASGLYQLSQHVADRQPQDPEHPEFQQLLDDSLRLDPNIGDLALLQLSEIGAALRNLLSGEIVEELEAAGFFAEQGHARPGLSIQEMGRVPIFWEMLYETGEDDEDDWRNFWGFRAPITHWMGRTRIEEIDLRHGIFTATHEGLRFAGQEVTLLGEQLQLPKAPVTLAAALREQVDQSLLERLQGDQRQVDAWWEAADAEPNSWLARFLADVGPAGAEPQRRQLEALRWKRDALKRILRQCTSSVMHFACHCQPAEDSEFLSQLDMSVAGEAISLPVSLLSSPAGRRPAFQQPGPLVFLNACGTGQQSPTYEPPGFPEVWVMHHGALAVLATICPVPDFFAHAFARKFYELLLTAAHDPGPTRNQYVAEALLATRRHFIEEYGNPLGLAYILYAVKGAHISNDFPNEVDG
jgi:hypothetical protein